MPSFETTTPPTLAPTAPVIDQANLDRGHRGQNRGREVVGCGHMRGEEVGCSNGQNYSTEAL